MVKISAAITGLANSRAIAALAPIAARLAGDPMLRSLARAAATLRAVCLPVLPATRDIAGRAAPILRRLAGDAGRDAAGADR